MDTRGRGLLPAGCCKWAGAKPGRMASLFWSSWPCMAMPAGDGLCACMLGPAVHRNMRLRHRSDVCSCPVLEHMHQSELSMSLFCTGARHQQVYAVTSTTALHVHRFAVDTVRFQIQTAEQLKTLCMPAQLSCKCLLALQQQQ